MKQGQMWRPRQLFIPALLKADGSNQQGSHIQAAAQTRGFVQTVISPSHMACATQVSCAWASGPELVFKLNMQREFSKALENFQGLL